MPGSHCTGVCRAAGTFQMCNGTVAVGVGRRGHTRCLVAGSIPEELGQLALLRELYLNANGLTGPLPGGAGTVDCPLAASISFVSDIGLFYIA